MKPETPALEAAWAEVARYVRQRSRTFQYATLILPAERRQAMWAAYAFFRQMDDLVDEDHISPEAFRDWRNQAVLPASKQTDPILLAWADVRQRYSVNDDYVRELLDGIEQDIRPRQLETRKELYRYCRSVASTVGLLTLPILGLRPGVELDKAEAYAVMLGLALQMTNVLRDVREDVLHGRVYLPREDMEACGVALELVQHGYCSEQFRRLMARLLAGARLFYQEAWPGIQMLAMPGRLAVGIGALGYLGLLEEIERDPCLVLRQKVRLSRAAKLRILAGSISIVFWPDRLPSQMQWRPGTNKRHSKP